MRTSPASHSADASPVGCQPGRYGRPMFTRDTASLALLDAAQHLSFHDQRGGLHRNHAQPSSEGGQSEAVATDQSRRAVTCLEEERPYPVAVLGAPREQVLAHARHAFDWIRSRWCRRPGDAETRAGRGRRCACRDPGGSRSGRRCTLRRAAKGPSGRPMTRLPWEAPITIACVSTPSASPSNSSPGSVAAASAFVAPHVRTGSRRNNP